MLNTNKKWSICYLSKWKLQDDLSKGIISPLQQNNNQLNEE